MRTDIFARLDREPEPPKIEIPRMSRTRLALFGGTLAFYLAIVVAVLASTWLVIIDWKVMLFRPYQQWPELHAFLDYFVVLGQRGPTAVMVAAWLGWRSWRQHTLRPCSRSAPRCCCSMRQLAPSRSVSAASAPTTRRRSVPPNSSPAAIYFPPGIPQTRS